jgi:hypothetical protein
MLYCRHNLKLSVVNEHADPTFPLLLLLLLQAATGGAPAGGFKGGFRK